MIQKLVKKVMCLELGLGIKPRLKRWFSEYEKKVLSKRVYPALFNRIYPCLIENLVCHYGADYRWGDEKSQNLNMDTHSLGYGLIHYSIARNQRPRRVLCVGSMYGYIPFMLAKACEENDFGHVDFVDASFDINRPKDRGAHIYGRGFWSKIRPSEHFSLYLDSKRITTYVMRIEDFFRKYPKRMYDYIYLDGDHRYVGGRRALNMSWNHLNEEGYISLHDIHFDVVAEGINFEHWKVWREFADKNLFKLEFTNHYSGIGIAQKITGPRKMFSHNFDQDLSYKAWRKIEGIGVEE